MYKLPAHLVQHFGHTHILCALRTKTTVFRRKGECGRWRLQEWLHYNSEAARDTLAAITAWLRTVTAATARPVGVRRPVRLVGVAEVVGGRRRGGAA